MTPVIFVSFLVSLAWVDFRYTLMRSHTHAGDEPSRMPRWLHRMLYREAPYQYVRVNAAGAASGTVVREERGKWYYHSKQRKLMKMEVKLLFR